MFEKVHYPFAKGSLISGGAQVSAEKVTSTDDYEAVEAVTIYQPPEGYVLNEIEFGLAGQVRSSGAAEDVLYKWQASDDGTDWEDLCAEQTYSTPNTTLVDTLVMSGRFAPTGNFLGTGSTFQVRMVIKSGGAGGETAKGVTKNSSYIICRYRR